MAMDADSFFTEYGEANRFTIHEVIGKGSYGVVCSATDNKTGEKVAIKKITDVFEHVSDATRILREVKLLRVLKHPDIVEVKHIVLPPNPRDFKDIFVIFELMETDLHQVIKANDDLTQEHHQFFLYQLLRGLKYVHTANVYHRDLKPKNILANADCKLKICDFGLARPAFHESGPTTVFWTDYVATRWYRAPELCGSFFTKYTPAIDIWSIGCIFAEILSGRPLFPGKNVVHQLEIITDLLGTPHPDQIAKVRNEKARRFLSNMRVKPKIPFAQRFPKAAASALPLLERLLAFDPDDRPTAEEALADPYFHGLADRSREPSAEVVSRTEYAFESKKLSPEEVRDLLYKEILEYHPQAKREFEGGERPSRFSYAKSAVGQDFAAAEEAAANGGRVTNGRKELRRSAQSLPKESVENYRAEAQSYLTGGVGALKRSDSIHAKTPPRPVTQDQVDEMMDAAESMSLDDRELQEAAAQARAMMEANSRQTA
jgi:serine/threonine protein kinase